MTPERMNAEPLARAFYQRDPRDVGPDLLNKLLVRGRRVGRIIEVEAYCGAIDPGSHTYRGKTLRNATMFGPPGLLYVYFTYGMHFCANSVCGDEGEGVAVLLRAVSPLAGLEEMRARRPAARGDDELCSGPARLCAAFGLDRSFDGADLVTGDRGVVIAGDGLAPPVQPVVTTRIGLGPGRGGQHPWRYCVPGARGLSRRGGPTSPDGSFSPG
jgi:DNA-3-methyladenine glycosylase